MLKRTPYTALWKELSSEKPMVFLSGPRQSGKTTLGNMIATNYANSLYFNWDVPRNKALLVDNPTFFEEMPRTDHTSPLVILDEIHKFAGWKNYLKGTYDEFHESYQFLVMGSGRLDLYDRRGDSLAGRYFPFRLWPLTLAELGDKRTTIRRFLANPLLISTDGAQDLEKLWRRLACFSGFPEPYIAAKSTTFRRWSNTYSRQLIREDIRDLAGVRSVDNIEVLYSLLPSKVGSPLSVSSLARDLQVAYNTLRNWIDVLDRFYMIFSVPTWTTKVTRAIRKETKVYLMNYALVDDPARRFENMVALELLRAVANWNDLGYGNFSLHFIKDKEKREVDFLIADKNKPLLLVEAKLSETQASASLIRFQEQLGVPAVQLIDGGTKFRLLRKGSQRLLIAPAWLWLARLP